METREITLYGNDDLRLKLISTGPDEVDLFLEKHGPDGATTLYMEPLTKVAEDVCLLVAPGRADLIRAALHAVSSLGRVRAAMRELDDNESDYTVGLALEKVRAEFRGGA
jgi:hypothetical protein